MESKLLSIYSDAKELWRNSSKGSVASCSTVRNILRSRSPVGLDAEKAGMILRAILFSDKAEKIISSVVEEGEKLRNKLYGNRVYLMAPIEVSNICSSECLFCGWRASNKEMKRKRLSEETVLAQAEYLLEMGIRHIEIVGGDDINFVKELAPNLITQLKKLEYDCQVSLCSMVLTERQYKALADVGLDAVLTWQETYNPTEYTRLIKDGPKAHALDEQYRIVRSSEGYKNRLESQWRASKAGLQVGVGAMLGLSKDIGTDIVATILHIRKLLSAGCCKKPIIIGMPTLNTIVSKTANAPLRRVSQFQYSYRYDYAAIAALYLLSNPDHSVWIFPNCRVPISVQAHAVKAAGYFTSTQTRLGPGGYLLDMLKTDRHSETAKRLLVKEYGRGILTSLEHILNMEQFEHHYYNHCDYVDEYAKYGIKVTT